VGSIASASWPRPTFVFRSSYHCSRRYPHDGAGHEGGAVEFLTKPFRDQDLLDAIQVALERDRARHQGERKSQPFERIWESLTQRERELSASGRLSGLLNKQLPGKLELVKPRLRSIAVG